MINNLTYRKYVPNFKNALQITFKKTVSTQRNLILVVFKKMNKFQVVFVSIRRVFRQPTFSVLFLSN